MVSFGMAGTSFLKQRDPEDLSVFTLAAIHLTVNIRMCFVKEIKRVSLLFNSLETYKTCCEMLCGLCFVLYIRLYLFLSLKIPLHYHTLLTCTAA